MGKKVVAKVGKVKAGTGRLAAKSAVKALSPRAKPPKSKTPTASKVAVKRAFTQTPSKKSPSSGSRSKPSGKLSVGSKSPQKTNARQSAPQASTKAAVKAMPPSQAAKAGISSATKASQAKASATRVGALKNRGGGSAPAPIVAAANAVPVKKTEGPIKKMAARAKIADIVLPVGYRPTENEPFMNEMHRAYFRKRLLEWKDDILRQTRETLAILHEDSAQHADLADRATSETDRATELRTRDRQRKLIAKIDAALTRIEDGSYGYCEDTGEPIGLKRLDARPIATLSVEAQERHERREKVYREE